jgi:CRP-like cAMP-binding protein
MALDNDVRNLARNPTFAELEPEALRLIAFSAETRILRAGDVLFRRNDPSDGGFFILSGSIALEASDHGAVASQIAGPSALIGDLAMITATLRPATAIAREPSSVLKISRQLFHRVLLEFPLSAERLRQAFAARARELGGELEAARRSGFKVTDAR